MIIDFFSSQLINAFISHVRNLDLGRCLNELPRIQIGECEIKYTCGTYYRQVVCLFHDIPCVRTGGRHLVLFRFHYWNKGISCVQPFVGFGIRCSKGIWRALKKLMSTDFSYMVISGCARASRATAATFPRFCEYRSGSAIKGLSFLNLIDFLMELFWSKTRSWEKEGKLPPVPIYAQTEHTGAATVVL